MEDRKILLTEGMFTQICKHGFLRDQNQGRTEEIYFTKKDITDLIEGKIVEKPGIQLMLGQTSENPRNIVKRSPIFFDLY